MTNQRSVLLISHDAYRTGGPVMVLNMAQLLKEMGGQTFYFLIKNPIGDLMADFEKMAPTFVPIKENFVDKVERKLKGTPPKVLPKLPPIDLVISNTITNGHLYPSLAAKNVPIITYVHELEIATRTYTSKEDLEKVLRHTHMFAVPSKAVHQFLTEELKVPSEKISRMDYFMPPATEPIGSLEAKEALPFAVGGVGTTDWRKGTDLFLAVAKEYSLHYPTSPVLFKWKGVYFDTIEYHRLAYEIKKAGLEHVVQLEKADAHLAEFYRSIHLFLLTSREDPYPLVALEGAKHRMPIICFAGNGGIAEFVEESGGGKLVPFLSVSEMAKAIHEYVTNRVKLKEEGQKALVKLEERHYNKEHIVTQFEQLLEKAKRK